MLPASFSPLKWTILFFSFFAVLKLFNKQIASSFTNALWTAVDLTSWRLFYYCRCGLRSSHFNKIALRGRIAEHWELLGTVQSSAISPAAIEQRKTTEWWTRNFRGLFSKLRDELLPLFVIIKQLKTVAEHSNRNLTAEAGGFLEGLHQTLVANCTINAFWSPPPPSRWML